MTSLLRDPGSRAFLVAAVGSEGRNGLGRFFRPLQRGESVRSLDRPQPVLNCEPCLP